MIRTRIRLSSIFTAPRRTDTPVRSTLRLPRQRAPRQRLPRQALHGQELHGQELRGQGLHKRGSLRRGSPGRGRPSQGVIVVLTAIWLSSLGCGGPESEGLAVYISGDTAGWITPCGCAANQSGGLARRSTLIQSTDPKLTPLVLDAGGSGSGTTEYHQLKLAAILRGMQSMGLTAHNIGTSEANLGPARLRELSHDTGVQWLSANLKSVGEDWSPQPVITVDRGGLRVAVVGVIDPDRVTHDAWKTRQPLQAVLDAIRDVQADVRIVLAYMSESQLRELAGALPEVDFVVGGPTGQAMSPVSVGSVTVLSATNKGKFLARLKVRAGEKRQAVADDFRLVEVASSFAEDETQLENLADYYRRLAERDFPANQTGLVSSLVSQRADYAIAGSDSCAPCHAKDDAVWHASRHSHAWDVLLPQGANFDPFCQQCHTTGYGLPGGFTNVAQSRGLTHVGCENCHGPSQAHVADPRVKTPFLAQEQCLECHDHENSPNFVHQTYWAKIVHGSQKKHVDTTPGVEHHRSGDEL